MRDRVGVSGGEVGHPRRVEKLAFAVGQHQRGPHSVHQAEGDGGQLMKPWMMCQRRWRWLPIIPPPCVMPCMNTNDLSLAASVRKKR